MNKLKKTALAISLFAAISAHATDSRGPASAFMQGQSQYQQLQQTAAGGDSTNNINIQGDDHDSHRIPVASAIAPGAYTSVICPIISPNSHAVQFLVFGGSTTGKSNINAICVAFHLQQFDVVQRMMCEQDAAYRKANGGCK